jgi:hypothetical protein
MTPADIAKLWGSVRATLPQTIAEEICSVQPMHEAGKALVEIMELLKPSPEFPNGRMLTFGAGKPEDDS